MNPSLLWSVANHLWQSTIFVALTGLLTLAFRNNRAAIRYWLWFAASIKFLVPFSTLIDVGGHYEWRTAATIPAVSLGSVIERVGQPFAAPILLSLPPVISHASPSLLPMLLLAIWAIGCIAVLCSWYLRLRGIRSALRNASPLPLPIEIPALTSPAFSEPGVFGILQPILLLPTSINDHLTAAQLEGVVSHELCHVRRRDNLTSIIHMAVEAVFWFHPLVWWLGARLMDERERACDEEVLRKGHDPQSYAEGILKICELYLASPLQCVAGVTGSNLKKRIEMIMTNPIALQLNFARKLTLTVAGTAAFLVPVAVGVWNAPPLKAQAPPPRAAPPASTAKPVATPQYIDPQRKPPRVFDPQVVPRPIAAVTPPTAAVILVLDRSSSMEGKKLQWALAAASHVVESLRPGDTVGVLAFDNTFEWAVVPSKVEDRAAIEQQIAAIIADGGTKIAPALTEAYARLLPITADLKHLVLLTDGISEAGDSLELARAANGNVTISTVGLGRDVNRQYLETVAKLSGGKSYFATDPQQLEQILVSDVLDHTGSAQ
jgi:beta-lactamase regulating signal transducer with metallopeptidase domain